MEMATLQFYKNKYRYPKYSAALTAYGSPMECTPVGIGLRGGTLRVRGTMDDFMSCNYISLSRGGNTLYAWIDNVEFRTEESFDVSYSVDAWRTYKSKISLGTQFIKRSPSVTYLKDPLLGSVQPYPDVVTTDYVFDGFLRRVAVVQVRTLSGDFSSNGAAQPTPYQFYLIDYALNRWNDTPALVSLMGALAGGQQTKNIATIYSIPYIDLSSLPTAPLIVTGTDGATLATVNGFKILPHDADISDLLSRQCLIDLSYTGIDLNDLMRVNHSVQLVIPEAGIINIPDELLTKPNLALQQDIDLFSGACNYMLTTGDAAYYTQSVRGSSVSSIPILSNPEDTYISQNQNALTTALIGDVAGLAISFGMMGMGPAGKFLGSGMANDFLGKQFGTMGVVQAGTGILDTMGKMNGDQAHNYVNPPAFLGTAMAANFNGMFWVVITKEHADNQDLVHGVYGYPYNKIDSLVFPAGGYIETSNCNVESTDGSVPRWALDEINSTFNNGILVK